MKLLCSIALFVWSISISADTIIINHKSTGQKTLMRYELQAIFLLRPSYWNNGSKVIPVFVDFDSPIHSQFVSSALHLSLVNYDVIIRDRIQRGDASHYVIVADAKEAIAAVSHTPGAIAYIPSINLIESVPGIQIINIGE